jgi:hypothetical protein
MNCADARPLLPGLLHGDLPPDEAARLRAHLAACPACAAERREVHRLALLLDALPAPPVRVDLAGLYREAAARQDVRLRRWRRAALAACAAAAAVVAVVALSRLEVRVEPHQVVLRWGEVPPDAPAPAPLAPPDERPPAVAYPPPSAEVEDRLRLIGDLLLAMEAEAERSDDRRDRDLAALRAEVQELHRQLAVMRMTTNRDVAALYAALFPDQRKGESP